MCFKKIFIILMVIVCSGLSHAQPVHVAIGEWLPFVSATHKHNGLLSHIVTEAFASQGLKTQYGFYPWARAFSMVASEKADVSIGWVHSEDRVKEVAFSDPLMKLDDVFYFRKEDVRSWNKVTDFSDKRIGITKSFFYGEEFTQAQKDGLLTISIAKDDVSNFKMLLTGRIDVFPIVRLSAQATLKAHFKAEQIAKLDYDPKPVKEVSYRIIFSRSERGETLRKAFNAGLKELKESGKYKHYWQQYDQGFYIK